ncbi:MAG: GH3 auxin-responsive promoter [Thalassobius sp.]|nr:GH3 auxin-responsive promoter [Thalassovita sp.]
MFDYNKMYDTWWNKTLAGKESVTWPGKVKYFALTSGTSGAASKRIPITYQMLKAIQKTGRLQILSMAGMNIPSDLYQKKVLMLNGCSKLEKTEGHFEGDLSGIMAKKFPLWFFRFYKPGKKISSIKDWNAKIDAMVKAAPTWDVGIIAGVPAWVQLLLSRIIDHYGLNNIHEIWPNFKIFAHGGVAMNPYKNSLTKLFGKEVILLETYLASEGFLAYEKGSKTHNMQLVTDNGIYFEFVPFNESNFGADGEILDQPEVLTLQEVEANVDYALLISTCAGTWRYLIGDVVRFKSVELAEIEIVGRTKHFISLCGEHLSVDNMNRAITNTAEEFGINIPEFTVVGIPHNGMFAHQWFLGVENHIVPDLIKQFLDNQLKELNDDYRVERQAALKEIFVEVLPVSIFYEFLKIKGKAGGQHKFPRVLSKEMHKEWNKFLTNNISR